MMYLFLIVFLFSPLLIVVGLIAPNFLRRFYKRDFTRSQNLKIYGALFLVSFFGLALTMSEKAAGPTEAVQTSTEGVALDQVNDFSLEPVSSISARPTETWSTTAKDEATYLVTRVVDGDTIEVLLNGEKKTIRYIGIDTPETVHPSKPVECFGKEASDKNKELVVGKNVRLEKDVSDTDKYGRLLRYVYVGDVFINKVLVAEGYANAYTYPPDVAESETFRQAEQSAREAKRGLWGSLCSETTQDVPSPTAAAPSVSPAPSSASPPTLPSQCSIKGNINADGEKIFHSPGCQSYNKTIINEDAGERWFCTEQEAEDAGWRKALNC